MSFENTWFVKLPLRNITPLPCAEILEHYAKIRDSIAETGLLKDDTLFGLVAHTTFVYTFNTFKAIQLLLLERYHESASAILRQLWEVSLNFHWISEDPMQRSQDFCNYTCMEHRKLVEQSGQPELEAFDSATLQAQGRFRFTNKNQKEATRDHFSIKSVRERAESLGGEWKHEYIWLFDLTSKHAHGSPSAILDAIFSNGDVDEESRRDDQSVALVAMYSIEIMNRNLCMLHEKGVIPDATQVKSAYGEFKEMMSKHVNLGNFTSSEAT